MSLSGEHVIVAIRDFFREVPSSGIRTKTQARLKSILVDEVYDLVTRATVDRVMRSNPLLIPAAPETELSDCDDFALHVKANITRLYRQENLASGASRPPPAIGIVVTGSHVLNAFLTSQEDGHTLALADASRQQRPIVVDPADAPPILGMLPVRLLYF